MCKNISSFNSNEDLKNVFSRLPSQDNFDKLFTNSFSLYDILLKYEKWKQDNDYIDFTDMLIWAYNKKYNPPGDILIVDEFQDLSPLQYKIYKIWSQEKKESYLAGDDDQTIYSFICADARHFIEECNSLDKQNGDEQIILDKTYRMNKNIHQYCKNYIRSYIDKENRIDKDVRPIKEGGELVEGYIDEDLNNVLDFIRPNKFTFILFRTNYYKRLFIEEVLIPRGIIYDEIRGKGLWNYSSVSLFNAIYKLKNKLPLSLNEVEYFVKNIDTRFKLLKRGVKTNFKNLDHKERYTISDLLELGFDFKIFEVDDYEKLFNLLKINQTLRVTFLETKKELISFPIKLKLGTIHSAKGKEADDVILFKDVSKRISEEASKSQKHYEDEIRVFYVGQSRPIERLVILRGGFKFADTSLIP
jgi:DNA helicase-2/ATP-dependent DNA helicase PcrA